MAERWREFCFRRVIPMTHAEYRKEPVVFVNWALAFDNMLTKMQEDAQKRAARDARHGQQ